MSSVRVEPSISGTSADTADAVGWNGWRGTAVPSTVGEKPIVIWSTFMLRTVSKYARITRSTGSAWSSWTCVGLRPTFPISSRATIAPCSRSTSLSVAPLSMIAL